MTRTPTLYMVRDGELHVRHPGWTREWCADPRCRSPELEEAWERVRAARAGAFSRAAPPLGEGLYALDLMVKADDVRNRPTWRLQYVRPISEEDLE